MTSNTHIYIKNKGAYTLMTPAEQQWLTNAALGIASLPAVLFAQNGSGADPVKGFMNANTIIHNLKISLANSIN